VTSAFGLDVQVNERARADVVTSDGHRAAESEAALQELAALSQDVDLG
jgi:hypothetical protein